jgi:hypothetical protein
MVCRDLVGGMGRIDDEGAIEAEGLRPVRLSMGMIEIGSVLWP